MRRVALELQFAVLYLSKEWRVGEFTNKTVLLLSSVL